MALSGSEARLDWFSNLICPAVCCAVRPDPAPDPAPDPLVFLPFLLLFLLCRYHHYFQADALGPWLWLWLWLCRGTRLDASDESMIDIVRMAVMM